jgi:hypothetical protein
MSLSDFDHLHDALGKQPIVSVHHFAIGASGGNLLKGDVMIFYHSYESLAIKDANSGVSARVSLSNG